MPIHVWVDRAQRLRRSAASGVVTDREFIDAYGGTVRDLLCDPTLDHLADFSAVDRFEVTPHALQTVARIMSRRIDPGLAWAEVRSNVAMVASSDAVYGALRMYQAYREADGALVNFRVCRTVEEAERWLGRFGKSPVAVAPEPDPAPQ